LTFTDLPNFPARFANRLEDTSDTLDTANQAAFRRHVKNEIDVAVNQHSDAGHARTKQQAAGELFATAAYRGPAGRKQPRRQQPARPLCFGQELGIVVMHIVPNKLGGNVDISGKQPRSCWYWFLFRGDPRGARLCEAGSIRALLLAAAIHGVTSRKASAAIIAIAPPPTTRKGRRAW
jgi:hypothetical protein